MSHKTVVRINLEISKYNNGEQTKDIRAVIEGDRITINAGDMFPRELKFINNISVLVKELIRQSQE